MSLKAFHLVFVTLAALLAGVTGFLCLNIHQAQQAPEYLIYAVASFVLAAGLVGYEIWFFLKMKREGISGS